MPVELTIVETTVELGQTNVEVILTSASEPGPAGPGVPAGGTDGQVLTKASATDFDTAWEDSAGGAGGAPTDATYLVTAAHADLSAEVVVGATPGGELGGTWASPTVDATHSGSSHAGVQAAAEATAAAALAAHEADTTGVHGIADTSALALTANHPTNATFNDHSARHENGGADEISLAGLDGTPTDLQTHLDDATAAHAGTAISVDSTNLSGTAVHVQGSLEELDNLLDDHSARHEDGGSDEISIQGLAGTPTELTNHLNDASDAHDASAISVLDSGAFYTATDVEGVLAEIAPQLGAGGVDDPIQDIFGTPDTAFEFDTSSLTGLTAMGTPDAESAHTTVPGHYYVRDDANSIVGRYAATPATPFTAIVKLSDTNLFRDFSACGMQVGVATPGALNIFGLVNNGRSLVGQAWTSPSVFSASFYTGPPYFPTPIYLAILVNSTTDVDFLWSPNGRTWDPAVLARNPGFTVGAIGMVLLSNSSGNVVSAAFDYLRIWNSAKTFPGIP